jgi:small subunit ribosomal protein S20
VAKKSKSSLKAHRQNVERRERNREQRAKLRTGLKAMRKALEEKDDESARQRLTATQSLVDRMAAKGIIHRNTAARHKSRLAARVAK